MAENSFLLFKRDDQDQDSHEDVWDDTALIQAYDRAVNLAKEKVASQLNLEDNVPQSTSLSDIPDEEQSGSPSKSTKKEDWKVGDYIRSVYSEDGIEYEAVVMKIQQPNSSCLIRYLGYENEEVVFVKDLKPSAGTAARKQQIVASRETAPESSSDMEQENEVFQTASKPSPMAGLDWQPAKPEPLPKFPGMSNMSSIPPPPPPTAWPAQGTAEMDSDSLYSMLMSWYMAGYHTGYYQGAQQRNKRKANSSGTS